VRLVVRVRALAQEPLVQQEQEQVLVQQVRRGLVPLLELRLVPVLRVPLVLVQLTLRQVRVLWDSSRQVVLRLVKEQ
jgi:hypothetical protein